MSEAFKPEQHLRKLRGRGGDADYLDVKWRIVWLRHEHPEAVIETEKVAGGMESNYAEFKARVSIPGGGSATGWGSETKSDFADFIEKAETKAVGRAIAALGYGTAFVGNELDENTRIVDAPVNRKGQRESADEHDEDADYPGNEGAYAVKDGAGIGPSRSTFQQHRQQPAAPRPTPAPPAASTGAPNIVKYNDPRHATTYEPQKALRAEVEAREQEAPQRIGAKPVAKIAASWTEVWSVAKPMGIPDRAALDKYLAPDDVSKMEPWQILARLRESKPAFTPTTPPPPSFAG